MKVMFFLEKCYESHVDKRITLITIGMLSNCNITKGEGERRFEHWIFPLEISKSANQVFF